MYFGPLCADGVIETFSKISEGAFQPTHPKKLCFYMFALYPFQIVLNNLWNQKSIQFGGSS